jgi:hypothetical protein
LETTKIPYPRVQLAKEKGSTGFALLSRILTSAAAFLLNLFYREEDEALDFLSVVKHTAEKQP